MVTYFCCLCRKFEPEQACSLSGKANDIRLPYSRNIQYKKKKKRKGGSVMAGGQRRPASFTNGNAIPAGALKWGHLDFGKCCSNDSWRPET